MKRNEHSAARDTYSSNSKNLYSYLKFMGKKGSQDDTRGVLVTKMK